MIQLLFDLLLLVLLLFSFCFSVKHPLTPYLSVFHPGLLTSVVHLLLLFFLPLFLVGKPDGELRELMEKAGAPAGVKPFLDGPIFTAGSRGPKR